MKYDPKIHYRRSIRLKGYDYSRAGAYFITICCEKMACRFGEVTEEGMILNELGEIAYSEWIKLEERFACFELDVFQIMPNHMHGIIVLKDVDGVGATLAVAQPPADHILEIDSSLKEDNLSKEKEEDNLSKEEDNLKKADKTVRAGASPARRQQRQPKKQKQLSPTSSALTNLSSQTPV